MSQELKNFIKTAIVATQSGVPAALIDRAISVVDRELHENPNCPVISCLTNLLEQSIRNPERPPFRTIAEIIDTRDQHLSNSDGGGSIIRYTH